MAAGRSSAVGVDTGGRLASDVLAQAGLDRAQLGVCRPVRVEQRGADYFGTLGPAGDLEALGVTRGGGERDGRPGRERADLDAGSPDELDGQLVDRKSTRL